MSLCTGEHRTPEKAIEQFADALYTEAHKVTELEKVIEGLKAELERRQEAKPLTHDDFIMHNCAGPCGCQQCVDYEKSRQEAKPLTVELDTYPMVACMASAFAHLEHQPETVELYQAAHDILAYIRANLPHDQSARIAQLQSQRDRLLTVVKVVVNQLEHVVPTIDPTINGDDVYKTFDATVSRANHAKSVLLSLTREIGGGQ